MLRSRVLRSATCALLLGGALAACASADGSHAADAAAEVEGGAAGGVGDAGPTDGGLQVRVDFPPSTPLTTRDWSKHPAIVVQDTFTTLYALSDVHGGYDRLRALLATWSLIPGQPASPLAVSARPCGRGPRDRDARQSRGGVPRRSTEQRGLRDRRDRPRAGRRRRFTDDVRQRH
jgi:hypothetical protein